MKFKLPVAVSAVVPLTPAAAESPTFARLIVCAVTVNELKGDMPPMAPTKLAVPVPALIEKS